MKNYFSLAVLFCLLSCHGDTDYSTVQKKYIESFSQYKYQIGSYDASVRSKYIAIIDSIIAETQNGNYSRGFKNYISKKVDSIPVPRYESEKLDYEELMKDKASFLKADYGLLNDFDFIDRFLQQKVLQYWVCDMGVEGVKTWFPIDTVLLYENKDYELPIRTEYNGRPVSSTILSNTLAGGDLNSIKFRTKDASQKFQKLAYQVQVLNPVTGESSTIVQELFIWLIAEYY